jgi:hypothetical protein
MRRLWRIHLPCTLCTDTCTWVALCGFLGVLWRVRTLLKLRLTQWGSKSCSALFVVSKKAPAWSVMLPTVRLLFISNAPEGATIVWSWRSCRTGGLVQTTTRSSAKSTDLASRLRNWRRRIKKRLRKLAGLASRLINGLTWLTEPNSSR